jgi:hypothetical protein
MILDVTLLFMFKFFLFNVCVPKYYWFGVVSIIEFLVCLGFLRSLETEEAPTNVTKKFTASPPSYTLFCFQDLLIIYRHVYKITYKPTRNIKARHTSLFHFPLSPPPSIHFFSLFLYLFYYFPNPNPRNLISQNHPIFSHQNLAFSR